MDKREGKGVDVSAEIVVVGGEGISNGCCRGWAREGGVTLTSNSTSQYNSAQCNITHHYTTHHSKIHNSTIQYTTIHGAPAKYMNYDIALYTTTNRSISHHIIAVRTAQYVRALTRTHPTRSLC